MRTPAGVLFSCIEASVPHSCHIGSPLSWNICRRRVTRQLGARALIPFAVDIGVDISVDIAGTPCGHARDRDSQSPLHLGPAGRRPAGAQPARSRCALRSVSSSFAPMYGPSRSNSAATITEALNFGYSFSRLGAI